MLIALSILCSQEKLEAVAVTEAYRKENAKAVAELNNLYQKLMHQKDEHACNVKGKNQGMLCYKPNKPDAMDVCRTSQGARGRID